ncbi:hypothetical protein KGQ34_04815 [Patescibacteria group bacterium]|nr:hypothetical protein [Patescibacteria group bacterium]
MKFWTILLTAIATASAAFSAYQSKKAIQEAARPQLFLEKWMAGMGDYFGVLLVNAGRGLLLNLNTNCGTLSKKELRPGENTEFHIKYIDLHNRTNNKNEELVFYFCDEYGRKFTKKFRVGWDSKNMQPIFEATYLIC